VFEEERRELWKEDLINTTVPISLSNWIAIFTTNVERVENSAITNMNIANNSNIKLISAAYFRKT